MKAVFLLVCIALIFASAKVIPMNMKQARTVGPETPSLEIEFQGTCEEFKTRVLASVTISTYTNCLPLRLVGPGYPVNAEIDDLHAHYFCTDKSKGRSVSHFVEIFSDSANEDAQPTPDFILALQPTAPFRVLSKGTTLSRRPNCVVTEDYCNATNPIVSACATNNVVCKKDWALNNDRIYITAHQKVTNDCKDNSACCNYITPSLFGGICNHNANQELLEFHEHEKEYRPEHRPERPQEEHRPERPQEEHRPERPGYGRPQEEEHRPERPGYGRPQEEEHRPEHKPGHGKPGHGKPGHREEEEEDKKRTEEEKKPETPKKPENPKEDDEEED